MSKEEKPVGQSNLEAIMEPPVVMGRQIQKTPEMVAARRPVGNGGDLLADTCQWCFSPFAYTVGRNGAHRSSLEYEQLCDLLHIHKSFQPVICDACYDYVMGTAQNAVRGFNEPGWQVDLNGARPNILLRP